ncbi:MAG: glutamate ligase domain-containing protein, partial [Armatimonadaceae bacterium]
GRFQVFRTRDRTLVLDVAHNPEGARELMAALRGHFPASPVILVTGTSRNHDPLPFLQEFVSMSPRVVATEPAFRPNPAAMTADAALELGLRAEIVVPVPMAVEYGLSQTPPGGVCCVTGSFFVVGDIPRDLLPQKIG